MLKHSKYFKVFDGCAILCFDFSFFNEALRQFHEDEDGKGVLGLFAMRNRLIRLASGWKERLGPDLETSLANRIGGDGAFLIFKGKDFHRNVRRALCCARELQECHADASSVERFKLPMDDFERFRRELLHIGIHVGRVYRHSAGVISLPPDEAKYDYVSHDMNISARIMRIIMKEKYDAVLSEQAWNYAENLLVENIHLIRPNRKTMPVGPDAKVMLYGVNFDTIDWEKAIK